MSKKNEEDFRVVDRRVSSTGADAPVESAKEGSGFVMKEKPEAEAKESPQIDFATFVFSLATSALIHLGLAPDPATNQIHTNVELAKQNIDILGMLEEKTKGNLSEEEANLIEGLLAEIRLRYVQVSHG